MVPIHSARLHSCRGQHAGSWLSVFPVTFFSVARSRHYRLALRARVGLWLPGLASGTVACGGCGMPVDVCGMHYGSCKNRGNMWTIRHDLVESALISLLCYLRLRARSTRAAGNLFNDDRPPRVGPGGQARVRHVQLTAAQTSTSTASTASPNTSSSMSLSRTPAAPPHALPAARLTLVLQLQQRSNTRTTSTSRWRAALMATSTRR